MAYVIVATIIFVLLVVWAFWRLDCTHKYEEYGE